MPNLNYRIPVGSASIIDVEELFPNLLRITFTDQVGQGFINLGDTVHPTPQVGHQLTWDGKPVIQEVRREPIR